MNLPMLLAAKEYPNGTRARFFVNKGPEGFAFWFEISRPDEEKALYVTECQPPHPAKTCQEFVDDPFFFDRYMKFADRVNDNMPRISNKWNAR